MRKVKLSDLWKESKVESINPDSNKRIKVKLNVQGVEKRAEKNDQKGATMYFIRKAGQFIYGKQNFHKGAFGIIPDELNNFESSSDIPSFDISSECNPEWIYYFFKQGAFYKKLEKYSKGTGSKRIHPDKIGHLEIPLPSRKDQDRILSKIKMKEKDISELSSINNINEIYISKLRQAILQEAVHGKLVPQDPNDEPASELLKKIQKEKDILIKEGKIKKQKPLPPISEDEIPYELPKGWEWVRFSNLIDFRKKYPMKRGPFGSAITKNIFVPKGTKTFKVYEQKNAIYNNSKLGHYYINESDFERLKGFEVEGGDIIISCSGTIGKIGFLPENAERGIINQALLKLCIDESVILNKYFGFLFEEYIMKSEKLTDLKGTAMKNIPPIKTLQIMPVPLPPLSEQKRIVEKVDKLMAYCDELEKQVKENQANSKQLMEAVLTESFER